MMLKVIGTEEEWGGGRPVDVEAVCRSSAGCFDIAIAEKPLSEAIRIEPGNLGHPRILHERSEQGEIRILLDARDRLWARTAYQFGHEYCHVISNFRPPENRPCDWLEESFCELASIFAIRSMAHNWREAPPYPNWASYADSLHCYAEKHLADPQHQIPEGLSFPVWLRQTLPLLEEDRYRRDDNTRVAIRLLSLFENDTSIWSAIRYLNLWPLENDDMRFSDFFDVWRSVTPLRLHGAVNQIEHRLLSGG